MFTALYSVDVDSIDYRDRKRGGPPTGRWYRHIATADRVRALKISRTLAFMTKWITTYTDSEMEGCIADTAKVSVVYRRLKPLYDQRLIAFIVELQNQGINVDDANIGSVYENGDFRFRVTER